MKSDKIRQNVFPILAALIWGTAFVAQSVSTDYVDAFTFTALRSVIAFIVLLVIAWIFTRATDTGHMSYVAEGSFGQLALGGICCGALLNTATCLQQIGMSETSAGKAGFITALYVVLVPIFGIFLKKKAPLPVWISVAIAVVGLYLLCIKENFTIETGDFYVFLGSIVFAFHILCVDHFAQKVDGLRLSCVQFLTCAILSGICSLFFEQPNMAGILRCAVPIIYVGVFSSGVAYTLQILAMKGSDPTVVTVLLSLESVFSVLAGAVILGDRLAPREYVGCALVFAAVLLAQIPLPKKKSAGEK